MRPNIKIAYLGDHKNYTAIEDALKSAFTHSHSVDLVPSTDSFPAPIDGSNIEGVIVDLDSYQNPNFLRDKQTFVSKLKENNLEIAVFTLSNTFNRKTEDYSAEREISWMQTGIDDFSSVALGSKMSLMILAEKFKHAANRYRTLPHSSQNDFENITEVGLLSINLDIQSASFNGHPFQQMTVSEIKILNYLAENPDIIRTREEIANNSGIENCDERTIDSHIKRIRQKIDPDKTLNLIETFYGQGYSLNAFNANNATALPKVKTTSNMLELTK